METLIHRVNRSQHYSNDNTPEKEDHHEKTTGCGQFLHLSKASIVEFAHRLLAYLHLAVPWSTHESKSIDIADRGSDRY
jgi:hypothetical protein